MNSKAMLSFRKKYILILVLLSAGIIWNANVSAKSWEQKDWQNTVYYRGSYGIPDGGKGFIRITAIDSYELTLNGTAVGKDTVWTTMEEYPVTFKSGKNDLLVKVTNHGRGEGSGLLVEIETDIFKGASNVLGTPTAFWQWTEQDPSSSDASWGSVRLGNINKSGVIGLKNPTTEPITGSPGDVEIGSPDRGITLSQVQGENLALGMPANHPEATDGVLTTSWEPGVNALNKYASIDLSDKRQITGVRVITKGPSYRDNSLRGYSVQVSDDQFRWSEIAVLHNITKYDETVVDFEPILTRYVRIVVAEIDAITAPRVAEIEVYGEGYSPNGSFVSAPLDIGEPNARKNFGKVKWEADIPKWTDLTLQFQTSNDGTNWSDWTDEYGESDILLSSPEPAKLIQYKVNLSTSDVSKSPRIKSILFNYSTTDIAASEAQGYILPNSVPMGRDTLFTYNLALKVTANDSGISKIIIQVPGQAALDDVLGLPTSVSVRKDSVKVSPQGLEISLSAPIKVNSQLTILFRTILYGNAYMFRSFLLSQASDNLLNVAENTSEDHSWSVFAVKVSGDILADVRANPRVVSPNGDGVCDYTVIEFTLSRVSEAKVEIKIFDLTGALVKKLKSSLRSAGRYVHPPDRALVQLSPGYWDGKDDNGKLLPPGLYIYRVSVDADTGEQVASGSVVLSY